MITSTEMFFGIACLSVAAAAFMYIEKAQTDMRRAACEDFEKWMDHMCVPEAQAQEVEE